MASNHRKVKNIRYIDDLIEWGEVQGHNYAGSSVDVNPSSIDLTHVNLGGYWQDWGYYEWNTQGTLTDRDWLHQIMGSTDLYDTAGVDTPSQGNGSHANIRKYQVSRFVPGGRSIEFRLSWPDGGLTLTEDAIIYVRLYGYELIPRDN